MLGENQSGDPRRAIEVDTVALLNLYPAALRTWGMRVTVVADGITRILTKGLASETKSDNGNWLVEGAPTNSINTTIYSREKSLIGGPAVAQAHPILDVALGPDNAVYHVEAIVVAIASAGATGGSMVISGTFKKDNGGTITQIGATETPYGPQEDLGGALAASFVITGGGAGLSCDTATAANVNTHCVFKVVTIINAF